MKWNRRRVLGFVARATLGAGLTLAAGSVLAQGYAWPKFFNVVTPVVGTGNHSLAVAWTADFSAMTGSRARVLPAPNGYARGLWLNSGEGRLALVQASDYFDQMDAAKGYATEQGGPADTRMIHMNMVTPWGYIIRGDSEIKSIDDIGPGTRVALAKSSSFLTNGIDALLAYRGLKREDVTIVEVGNYGANTKIIAEGRADVAFTSPISGPSYQAEAGPHGIRWLELPAREKNPAAYDRYRDLQPGYVLQTTTSGTKSAIGIPMDHAFQANHVRADEDPEFVYQLFKWLVENHDAYKGDFTHAHMLNVDNLVKFLDIGALQPLHEGTIRYLKEKGRWTAKHQARQDILVTMAKERVALYQAAVKEATGKGMKIEPGNPDWVAFWNDYRTKHSGATLYGMRVLALN